MKLKNYERVDNLAPNDIFLVDGDAGTRTISANKLSTAIGIDSRIDKSRADTDYIAMMMGIDLYQNTDDDDLVKTVYYQQQLWTLEQMTNAVKRNRITVSEFESITDVEYDPTVTPNVEASTGQIYRIKPL
jgi:hypothetical protein